MTEPIKVLADCITWLADLNQRIYTAQHRAVQSGNRELVLLYWHIGREILERQQSQGWGAKVIDQLANDLNAAFSDMKGFFRRNLLYMRGFAEACPILNCVQRAVSQLPWGQDLVLLNRRDENLLTCIWEGWRGGIR